MARIFHLEVLGQYGLSKIQPTTGAWSEWQRNVHDQSDSKNFNSTIDSIVKNKPNEESKAEIHLQVSAAEKASGLEKASTKSGWSAKEPKSQRCQGQRCQIRDKMDWAVREWADVRSKGNSGVMKQNTLNRMGEICQLQST